MSPDFRAAGTSRETRAMKALAVKSVLRQARAARKARSPRPTHKELYEVEKGHANRVVLDIVRHVAVPKGRIERGKPWRLRPHSSSSQGFRRNWENKQKAKHGKKGKA